jgi:DNA-binding GntR family transcriptional regulator
VYGLLLSDLDISVRVEFRRHFEHLVVEIARKKSTPHLLDALKAIVAKEQDAVGADDAVWTVYALYKRAMMYLAHVGNRAATIDTHNLYIHALESGNDKDLKALRRKIGGNYAPLSERK